MKVPLLTATQRSASGISSHFGFWTILPLVLCLSGGRIARGENLSVEGNLTVDQNLTIAGDTNLSGPVWFGKLVDNSGDKGFSVKVEQGVRNYDQEVWVGPTTREESVWVEEYGWVQGQVLQEIYSDINYPYWVPPVYDENGFEIEPGYMADNWVSTLTGQEWITTSEWGVTGGHNETQTINVPGFYDSIAQTEYLAPQILHTATRSNAAWIWRNPAAVSGQHRELMVLSPGGLSLPYPDDAPGALRALLTHSEFEQSYTTPPSLGSGYQSFGSKMSKQLIRVWDEVGQYTDNGSGEPVQGVDASNEVKVEAMGLTLKQGTSSDGGATAMTTTTIITPSNASFGGNVMIKGIVQIEPQGDLSMGGFIQRPAGQ